MSATVCEFVPFSHFCTAREVRPIGSAARRKLSYAAPRASRNLGAIFCGIKYYLPRTLSRRYVLLDNRILHQIHIQTGGGDRPDLARTKRPALIECPALFIPSTRCAPRWSDQVPCTVSRSRLT